MDAVIYTSLGIGSLGLIVAVLALILAVHNRRQISCLADEGKAAICGVEHALGCGKQEAEAAFAVIAAQIASIESRLPPAA